MQLRKFRTPTLIALLLSCAALGSAKADDAITTVTKTTTTTLGEPSTITTTAAPGTVVYFRTASPDILTTTIEGRRKDLASAIDQARDRGDITASKAEIMKQELRRIAEETGSTTISYPVAVMAAEDLDLIGAQYGTVVTTAPAYVPIIAGSHFTVYNGKIFQLDDLSVRRVDLEARVTKDLLQGRLSAARAAELRQQLRSIGTEAAIYRADGNLNFKEAEHLYGDFDRVASKIERYAGKENN
jgi:hypothetical protein